MDFFLAYTGLICDEIQANEVVVLCDTMMINSTSDLLDTPLNLSISFDTGFELFDDRLFFTYKPNPEISRIEPLNTFSR